MKGHCKLIKNDSGSISIQSCTVQECQEPHICTYLWTHIRHIQHQSDSHTNFHGCFLCVESNFSMCKIPSILPRLLLHPPSQRAVFHPSSSMLKIEGARRCSGFEPQCEAFTPKCGFRLPCNWLVFDHYTPSSQHHLI